MNDVDRWVELDGPEPEEVRKLFDPLRAMAPSREEEEAMERDVLEALAHEETGAPTEKDLPLTFEAWAALSVSVMGAGSEARFEVLDEHDLGVEAFRRCEEHYFRSLAEDVAARRTTRADLYARLCGEEVARRRRLPEAPAEEVAAEGAPAAAIQTAPAAQPPPAAAPLDVATFQKKEEAPAGLPPVVRAPEALVSTAMAFELPTALREQQGKLPFVPAPPGGAGVPPGPAKTVPLRVAEDLTGTLPLGTDLMGQMRAALPFTEQTRGGGEADFPQMAVNNYASFCAELAVAPERKDAIMAAYGVRGEAARAAMAAHWRRRFAESPAELAVFDRLCAEYKAHLRARPR